MRKMAFRLSVGCIVMHLYFLRTIYLAFPHAWALALAIGGLFLVILAAMLLTHRLERRGHYRPARMMAFVAMPWMVILTWFCALSLAMDFWNLMVLSWSWFHPAAIQWEIPVRPAVIAFALVIAAATAWSVYEASHVRLEKVTFRTPRAQRPVRILQISDLHLGLTARKKTLERVLRHIERADADLVVSTGDLVDGSLKQLQPLAELMAQTQPRLGKYAVLGNHEYYCGLGGSLAFLDDAGFQVIRGECVRVEDGLCLAGVDDRDGHHMGLECRMDEAAFLPPRNDDLMVLLKHRPTVCRGALGRFDLQLSGHTHGGQISTDRVLGLQYPLRRGFKRWSADTATYVSRGAGTWGPPMRLFSPPEVTLITVEPA